jgi:hypothetical protein
MSPVLPASTATLILTLVMSAAAAPSAAAAESTLRCLGTPPDAAFLAAAHQAGWTVLPGGATGGPADLLLVDRPCDDEGFAQSLVTALDAGATVVLGLPEATKPPSALAARLPVNAWTFSNAKLLRYDAAVVPSPGAAFASVGGALAVSARWDLHLPGAPIENGLMRYLWSDYAKGPLVSDWQAQLACAIDGGLPLLVTGRSGPGQVAVFGADLWDHDLVASPGYPAFCTALLAWAKPRAAVAAEADAAQLTLAIARHQPDGLSVEVRNPGARAAAAVLSWKVCDWGREHFSAQSQEVRVAAGGSAVVHLSDGAPASALPWRRIDAALLGLDRRSVLVRRQVAVATAGQLSVTIEEDPSTYADMQDWALTDADTWCDGRIARRYVYRPGATAHLAIIVRNGLMDVAPLATAHDRQWAENLSTGGLNDLSYSVSGMRLPMPVMGGWSGRPAAEQAVALTWDEPVLVAGYRLLGYGTYRNWNRANPVHHELDATLAAGGQAVLAHQDQAAFTSRRGARFAWCEQRFAAASAISACTLRVTGLDAQANPEPHHVAPSNCSLQEWEMWGWPGASAPPAVEGALVVTATDLVTGTTTELLHERLTVGGAAEALRALDVVVPAGFTAVHLSARFVAGDQVAQAAHDLLATPVSAQQMSDREHLADFQAGLLCSPGWVRTVGFGLGMKSQTEGWGGDDDKLWAYGLDLLETRPTNRDAANRLFTSESAATHYTNPWRETPGGRYGWDLAADGLLKEALAKHATRVHVMAADRWNGIPIGSTWGWADFAAFDQALRAAGGPGLSGRSRGQLAEEIAAKHGDRWQRWHLEEYADHLLATQKTFADRGLAFTFESHGSFPLCGGELGAKLAKTHIAVGTDLFWELRNQDLWWSLGTRFGVVAANPDLRSGAYSQWGWDNSDCNVWWWANNGGRDTATRQWYATYFAGRVDTGGRFQPYHVLGWSAQGAVGTQLYGDEIAAWNHVAQLTCQVRPEASAGWGMVVSWAEQERRMGTQIGEQGFGLFAGKGQEQVDALMAHVWHKLVKNGLPVSFVTSTHALKEWRGAQPLVLVDGFAWSAWELAAAERANRAGAPLLCVGDDAMQQGEAAPALFGVRKGAGGWEPLAGTERVALPGGGACFVTARSGRGLVVWCPVAGKALGGQAAQRLVHDLQARVDAPLLLPAGLTGTPFISHGRLLLALCDQGDADRTCTVTVRPRALLAAAAPPPGPESWSAIDLDAGKRCAGAWDAATGTLTAQVEMPASGARMVLIAGGAP